MRLFITSYQKSGTHQIMPMLQIQPDVVDRGHSSYINAPSNYGLNREINWEGVEETVRNLKTFKRGSNKAFGHLAYMPEYAEVFRKTNTKVLFNIRDPRDVVVAEYENARRKFRADPKDNPLWNFYDKDAGKRIFEKDDPITDLIILAAVRWPRWLGWMDHDFVKVIKYEDLRLNAKDTIIELCDWLDGFGCRRIEEMVKSAQPQAGNPTFRRGVPGEWKTAFKLHHIELASELLGKTLERMGYE